MYIRMVLSCQVTWSHGNYIIVLIPDLHMVTCVCFIAAILVVIVVLTPIDK